MPDADISHVEAAATAADLSLRLPQATARASSAGVSVEPRVAANSSFFSLLYQVFNDWRTGIGHEIQVSKARGFTWFHLVLILLALILIEFNFEIYQLGMHQWQQSAGKKRQRRRGKRERIAIQKDKGEQLAAVATGNRSSGRVNGSGKSGSSTNYAPSFLTPPSSPTQSVAEPSKSIVAGASKQHYTNDAKEVAVVDDVSQKYAKQLRELAQFRQDSLDREKFNVDAKENTSSDVSYAKGTPTTGAPEVLAKQLRELAQFRQDALDRDQFNAATTKRTDPDSSDTKDVSIADVFPDLAQQLKELAQFREEALKQEKSNPDAIETTLKSSSVLTNDTANKFDGNKDSSKEALATSSTSPPKQHAKMPFLPEESRTSSSSHTDKGLDGQVETSSNITSPTGFPMDNSSRRMDRSSRRRSKPTLRTSRRRSSGRIEESELPALAPIQSARTASSQENTPNTQRTYSSSSLENTPIAEEAETSHEIEQAEKEQQQQQQPSLNDAKKGELREGPKIDPATQSGSANPGTDTETDTAMPEVAEEITTDLAAASESIGESEANTISQSRASESSGIEKEAFTAICKTLQSSVQAQSGRSLTSFDSPSRRAKNRPNLDNDTVSSIRNEEAFISTPPSNMENDNGSSHNFEDFGPKDDSGPLGMEDSHATIDVDHMRRRQSDLSSAAAAEDELEKIAIALKSGVTFMTVKKRKKGLKALKKKKFPRSFSGSSAVDFLCQYLKKPRAEALQVGRQLAQTYNLFVKCGGGNKNKKREKRSDNLDVSSVSVDPASEFLDESASVVDQERQQDLKSNLLRDHRYSYYRFFAYLPSEVKRMPLEQKMHIFEEGIKLKDHRHGLKTHKKCFRGKDAVNFLARVRLASSRADAVHLGETFHTQFNMFESVNRIDKFKDSPDILYRFVDKGNRYFSIGNELSTRLVMFQGNDVDWSSSYAGGDDGGIGGAGNIESIKDEDDFLYSEGGFGELGSIQEGDSDLESESDAEEAEQTHELLTKDHQRLCQIAEVLERGIQLKKEGTFVGSRAVTFFVTAGLAESRQEAGVLGRRLEREFNLFHEVTGKYDFGDSSHMFRFTDKDERHFSPLKTHMPLEELATSFEQGVKVKDYIHNLKTYKGTFVGVKAVDFLVNSGLAPSRAEAVRIGRQLVEHFNLFERVTGNREFSDDYVYFRFTPPEKRRTPEPADLAAPRDSIVGSTSVTSGRRSSFIPKQLSDELLELADWFLLTMKVKDNKFRAKTYGQTFVGTDAVSYLVNNSKAMSRKDGVELARCLSQQVGLFSGLDGTTDFKDDHLLYRFDERFQGSSEAADTSILRRGKVSGLEGISGVSVKSLPLDKIAEAFRSGIVVSDHRGRKSRKLYKDTFEGRDGVDFIVGHGLAEDRVGAVDLGRSMAREFNLFVHVKYEHEFQDAKHLYKFCYEGEIRPLEVLQLNKLKLSEIAKAFVANIKAKQHKMRLMVFEDTFLGSEAVDFLVTSNFASSRIEAVQMGRAITKEYNLFEHVTNDRKFEDADVPYYFTKEKDRYKGLLFERQLARRNVFSLNDECISDDGQHSEDNQEAEDLTDFQVSEEDEEWASKMLVFERKMRKAMQPNLKRILEDDDSVEAQWKRTTNKFIMWVSKFRRLDPRYQIRYFFDYVAQDGAQNMESGNFSVDNLTPILNFLPNRAQVFTVWRPTSLHAIRKMMCGEAVGKGLDIKGKSAKRGKLSGFVPFLQISENKHKSKIRPPSKDGVVRVFYPHDGRRARDIAAETLERVAREMIEIVAKAKKVLADKDTTEEARKDALHAMLLDMNNPKILYIDKYAPQSYGFEIPERLYWEAYFERQDITRKQGSQYDTGRPSQPAFQDMNFAAIRAQPKEDAPRACVFQKSDQREPMNPFELLVAYEEHGRVMPVVSDFDCFLVGTERVSFTSPLVPEQMDVLSWYVSEIENVMTASTAGDSWTGLWLDVLKKAAREGHYPEMPRFGFGDPKSYSTMKSAVTRLGHSGAVRHGAECFNYYFPQDLDDEFLVIADGLPGDKPWVYVDEEGLQDILSEKIDQGFTFPLNPKWVLCDAGRWYELYQKLLKSDKAETQQSMNVWFPPESGLREQIERVHELRPEGFYEEPFDPDDEASNGASSANLSVKTKLRKSNKDDHQDLLGMFVMNLLDDPEEDTIEDIEGMGDESATEQLVRTTKKAGKKVKKKLSKAVGKIFGKSPSKKAKGEGGSQVGDISEGGGENADDIGAFFTGSDPKSKRSSFGRENEQRQLVLGTPERLNKRRSSNGDSEQRNVEKTEPGQIVPRTPERLGTRRHSNEEQSERKEMERPERRRYSAEN